MQNWTKQKKLPVKAKSRLVVLGHLERAMAQFRRDAPTAAALSQALLALYAAAHKMRISETCALVQCRMVRLQAANAARRAPRAWRLT